MDNQTYRQVLKNELSKRIERNSHYSLRSFAKNLNINVGTLSSVLNKKRTLTLKSAHLILENLSLDPQGKDHFLASIYKEQKQRSLKRIQKDMTNYGEGENDSLLDESAEQKFLDIEIFKSIADWAHIAILEATFLKDFKSSESWIAKKLGISFMQTKLTIERLIKLGLLKIDQGQLVKSNKFLSSKDKSSTNSAMRQLQRSFLEKAIISLENDPISSRCSEGITMAIDPAKIDEARQKIGTFMQELCAFLEEGERSKLYQLNVNLFKLEADQKIKEKEL